MFQSDDSPEAESVGTINQNAVKRFSGSERLLLRSEVVTHIVSASVLHRSPHTQKMAGCPAGGENSPLLPSVVKQVAANTQPNGGASFLSTVINMMKTCMGTGCLALAYASQQGGLVLYVLGIVAIAGWNVVTADRLVRCLDLLHVVTTQVPPGASTLSKVAWYAFGPVGLHVVDGMVVCLLIGVLIAYVIAVVSFVGDTPLSYNVPVDAVVTGVAMWGLSLVPDFSYLAQASTLGLIVLAAAFVVIAAYGFADRAASPRLEEMDILELWPDSWIGVSHWFGIVVFGYGIVPLTYNFQESMAEPKRLVEATTVAVGLVAVIYLILGIGLYWLFPTLESDVLHELPNRGWTPLVTRLSMGATVLVTAPLLIVPCSQILEGRWKIAGNSPLIRCGVVGMSVLVAVWLPSFVRAVSLVGCFCVSLVSFCFPPLLHWKLLRRTEVADVLLLLVGVVVATAATLYTLRY